MNIDPSSRRRRPHGTSSTVPALVVLLLLTVVTLAEGALRSAAADSFEPNDDPGQAHAVAAGIEVESWISTAVDVDWYAFSTDESGTITVLLRSLPADYDAALFWLDPDSGELEQPGAWSSENSGTENESIQIATELAGSFFIQVYGVAGAHDPGDPYALTAIYPAADEGQPPTVTVLSPNGAEWLTAGTQRNISYFATDEETPAGNLAIALDYSTDGGATWIAIANSVQNTGSYTWTVPATPTMNGRVRVGAGDGALVGTDVSNTAFTIALPSQGPNVLRMGTGYQEAGGVLSIPLRLSNADAVRQIETYISFDPALVTYVDGEATGRGAEMTYDASLYGGNAIRLELSLPEGVILLAGEGAIANLTFALIGPPGTKCDLVPGSGKLQDPNWEPLSVSEAAGWIQITQPVTEAPVVTVASPNGAEAFAVGSQATILYSATDPDTPSEDLLIDLGYSSNGGSTWTTIAASRPNTGWHAWTVPSEETTRGRIRVIANDGSKAGSDVSDANFAIGPPPPRLNVVALGSAAASSGSEVVVPVTLANEDAVKSLVTEIDFDPAVATYVSGEAAGRGLAMSFTGSVVDGGKVRIDLAHSSNNAIPLGSGTIAELRFLLAGQGGAQTALTPTGTFLSGAGGQPLEVTEQAGSITVTSIASQPPVVTVVSPDGGETLTAGTMTSIIYVATDPDTPGEALSIDIEFSADGGAAWIPVSSAGPNATSYEWTVPIVTSMQGRIRVTAADGESRRSDTSNGDFTIQPPPARENRMAVGSGSGESGDDVDVPLELANGDRVKRLVTEITFDPDVVEYAGAGATDRGLGMTLTDTLLGPGRLRVQMSHEGDVTLAEGAGTLADLRFHLIGAGGTQTALTPTATVLTDAAGQPLDVTVDAGSILITAPPEQAPFVTVAFPNGGETLTANASATITYVATDPDTPSEELTIDLEYSTDGGASWSSIASSQPNVMSYAWIVPAEAVTSRGRVRATASDGARQAQDVSNADFAIVAPPSLQNRLTVGEGAGPSEGQATVAILLSNEDLIRSVASEIVFDPAVVRYEGGSAIGRAQGMVYSGQVVDGNRLRLSLFYLDASTLPAGGGVIAEVSFRLVGAAGTQTSLVPTGTVMIGVNDQPVVSTSEPGRIDVGPADLQAPTLTLSVLRNPGRPRSIQIFVHADQRLDQITVAAPGTEVPMLLIDEAKNIHMGTLLVGSEATSVVIEATGIAAGRTGSARTTVVF